MRPTRQDLAYGAGAMLDGWGLMGVKNTAHQVLNIVLGVNPGTIGTVMAIARLWDAMTDPLMGNISDNLRTRWGRRRPLIFVGAILSGLVFPLLWCLPTGLDPSGQFWWLLGFGLLFYTVFGFFSVPYHAFGYEIAPGYDEKTRLFAIRTAVGTINGIAVAWVFPLIQSGWFGAPSESARAVGWLVGGVFALLAILPAVGVKEPVQTAQAVQRLPRLPFWRSLRTALACRPFRQVAGAAMLATMGMNAVTVLGTYVSVYYVNGGDVKHAAVIGGIQFTVSTVFIIVSTPLVKKLSDWLGKKPALLFCFALALVGTVSKWFFYTPANPYLIIGVVFFLGPANAGFRTFADAMIADVCEYEEARSGLRLEGMFGAVYSWALKSGLALAAFLSGWILVWTGFDIGLGTAQSEHTLLGLRLLFAFFPFVALVGAAWWLRGYPLDAATMAALHRSRRREPHASSETNA